MEISKDQFISALMADGVLKSGNRELLSALFFADNCEATAPSRSPKNIMPPEA